MEHVTRAIAFAGAFRPMVFASNGELAVEQLLTDIPFFSIGLLAFGVFTFLFFMKSVTILSVYLYASALLAFLGSVIDLVPILALSHTTNSSLDDTFNGFLISRGVLFGLSVGLRFLFFWTFVAQPIKGERLSRSAIAIQKDDIFKIREQGHRASWSRWGITGLTLKWTILALVFAIFVIQILWRTANQLQRFMYFVGSAIETVVSILFVLKIGLNVFIAKTWKRAFLFYLAPLFALAISFALSLTDILVFLFSETTPGRFLQAIELYILIVYDLTSTFYPSTPSPLLRGEEKRSSSFRDRGDRFFDSSLGAPPRNVPGAVLLIGRSLPSPSSGRLSSLSLTSPRIPALFRTSPKSSRRQSGQERLLDENQAEKGRLPPLNLQTIAEPDLRPRAEELMDMRNWKLPSAFPDAPSDVPVQPLPATTISVSTPPATGTQNDRIVIAPSTERNVRDTAFSGLSYYGSNKFADSSPPPPPTPARPESRASPVYGLDGIVATTRAPRPPSGPIPDISSVTSFDDLLRKQRELDKSIEALRLFSPETLTPVPEYPLPEIPRIGDSTTTTPADSTSLLSDISLSNFPVPPSVSRQSSVTLRPVVRRSQRPRRQREDRPGAPTAPPPILIPPVDADINGRLPQTVGATGVTGRFQKFDSAGTQYDVTSFIGDLSEPSAILLTGLTSALRSGLPSDGQSGDGDRIDEPVAAPRRFNRRRPTIFTLANSPFGSRPSPYSVPATASSGLLNSQIFTGTLGSQGGLTPQRSATTVTPKRDTPGPLISRGSLNSQMRTGQLETPSRMALQRSASTLARIPEFSPVPPAPILSSLVLNSQESTRQPLGRQNSGSSIAQAAGPVTMPPGPTMFRDVASRRPRGLPKEPRLTVMGPRPAAGRSR